MISNAWTKFKKKKCPDSAQIVQISGIYFGIWPEPGAGQTWYEHFYTPSITYIRIRVESPEPLAVVRFCFISTPAGHDDILLVNKRRSRCGGWVSQLRTPRESRKTATVTFQLSGSLLLLRGRRALCATFSVSDNVSALSFEIREWNSFRSCSWKQTCPLVSNGYDIKTQQDVNRAVA